MIRGPFSPQESPKINRRRSCSVSSSSSERAKSSPLRRSSRSSSNSSSASAPSIKKSCSRSRSKSREKQVRSRSRSKSKEKQVRERHRSRSRSRDRQGPSRIKRAPSREKRSRSRSRSRGRSSRDKSSKDSRNDRYHRSRSRERRRTSRERYGRRRSPYNGRRSRSRERKRSRSRSHSRDRYSRSRDRRRSRERHRRHRSSSRGGYRRHRSRSKSRGRLAREKKEKFLSALVAKAGLTGDVANLEKVSNLPLNLNLASSNVTPQLVLQQTMAAMSAQAQALTGISLPKYYNPAAVNPLKYAEQVQKRKLLWQPKEKTTEQKSGSVWQNLTFSQDQDGKMTAKFRKLMGIKGEEGGECSQAAATAVVEPVEEQPSTEVNKDTPLKKQELLFRDLDQQYEMARMSTHTHRGVGLGYTSHGSMYPAVPK